MKTTRILTFILILAMFVLLHSCRTVFRQRMESDSSTVKTEQIAERWHRETIREYLPGRIDTINQVIQVPKIVGVPQPYPYYREIIRDSGEKQQSKNEETSVVKEEKNTEKEEHSPWFFIGIGGGIVFALLLLVIIAYKVLKARLLSSFTKAVKPS